MTSNANVAYPINFPFVSKVSKFARIFPEYRLHVTQNKSDYRALLYIYVYGNGTIIPWGRIEAHMLIRLKIYFVMSVHEAVQFEIYLQNIDKIKKIKLLISTES